MQLAHEKVGLLVSISSAGFWTPAGRREYGYAATACSFCGAQQGYTERAKQQIHVAK